MPLNWMLHIMEQSCKRRTWHLCPAFASRVVNVSPMWTRLTTPEEASSTRFTPNWHPGLSIFFYFLPRCTSLSPFPPPSLHPSPLSLFFAPSPPRDFQPGPSFHTCRINTALRRTSGWCFTGDAAPKSQVPPTNGNPQKRSAPDRWTFLSSHERGPGDKGSDPGQSATVKGGEWAAVCLTDLSEVRCLTCTTEWLLFSFSTSAVIANIFLSRV